MRRLARRLGSWWRWRQGSDGSVKVAGSLVEREARSWAETLRSQGIRAEVYPQTTSPRRGQPPLPTEWDVWVPPQDEPQARLILGLSGHSVIRLPRQIRKDQQ